MPDSTDEKINRAVLRSFEIGLTGAAEESGISPTKLADYQYQFVAFQQSRLPKPVNGEYEECEPTTWEKLRKNPFFDMGLKVVLTVQLILICWLIPYELQPYVDPLTNTVIWQGFTAAYLTALGGLVLDLVFWVQHPANFGFLNPFFQPGTTQDYETLMQSNQLTPIEKCKLNQQKYLVYFFCYCLILMALANLTRS